MRKLKTRDVPVLCRCLKAIGIKDEIKAIAQNPEAAKKDAWDKGFDLVYDLFDKATEENGEQYIYTFLSGPFEMDAEAVADMDIADLFAAIKQLAEENDLAGFFGSALRSMK